MDWGMIAVGMMLGSVAGYYHAENKKLKKHVNNMRDIVMPAIDAALARADQLQKLVDAKMITLANEAKNDPKV